MIRRPPRSTPFPTRRSSDLVLVDQITLTLPTLPLGPWRSVGVSHNGAPGAERSEEHTSELQSQSNLVCRLLLEKKKKKDAKTIRTPYTNRDTHNYLTISH